MTGWLKAGLIGGGILIVLQLIGLIPLLGCVTLPLTFVVFIVTGALSASYTPPIRQPGQGAGQGLLAALISQLVGGVVGLAVTIIQASTGATARAISQIPPQALQQIRDLGIPARMLFGTAGASIIGSICCVIGIVIAVGLGAMGGAIYASLKPS